MELVSDPVVPEPADPVRAVTLAVAGVTAIAAVATLVGGALAVLPSVLAAALYVGVEVAVVTLPALFVLQALVGGRATPSDTVGALAAGLTDGAALLLALAPLGLFFGAASSEPYAALATLLAVTFAGVVAGLVRTRRALLEVDPSLSLVGRLVLTAWGLAVALVALPAFLFGFRAALRVLA